MNKLLFTLFSISLFIIGCGKDTCNENLGVTFNNITPDSLLVDNQFNVRMVFKLNVLDILPENYFTDFKLNISENNPQGYWWENSSNSLDTIFVTKENLSFTIHKDSLPDTTSESLEYNFHLIFLDRRNYINCEHLGSDDKFYLDFSFVLTKLDSTSFEISSFFWKETLFKGGY